MSEIQKRVRYALLGMGVNPSLRGFRFLVDAIVGYAEKEINICLVYKNICAKREITFGVLEHCVRTCLADLRIENIKSVVNGIAGCSVVPPELCLTMNSFVSLVGEVMRVTSFEYALEQVV